MLSVRCLPTYNELLRRVARDTERAAQADWSIEEWI